MVLQKQVTVLIAKWIQILITMQTMMQIPIILIQAMLFNTHTSTYNIYIYIYIYEHWDQIREIVIVIIEATGIYPYGNMWQFLLLFAVPSWSVEVVHEKVFHGGRIG